MWKNLRGYVILQIEGLGLARFLQRLLLSGVRVFCIRRVDETTATLGVLARDFKRLRPIRRRERCRIRILKRHGFPFVWKRLRRRPVLLYGVPLCVAALWILGTRIWTIRIEGAVRTDPGEVYAMLGEHGLSIGKRPKGNVLILAADDLSARLKDAAWVSLNRAGILLRVTVHESDPQTETPDWSTPADLIAKKDAVVVSVETKRGKAQVQPGQPVKRGDVLISGHVVYSEDRTAYDTRADGTVTGACVYIAESELPATVTEYVESGSAARWKQLLICGIPLWNPKPPFERYLETSDKTVMVSLFGLPVSIRSKDLSELTMQERILSESERREQAELYAVTDAVAMVPHDARICSIHTVEQTEGTTVRVRCTVVTEERIGLIKEYGHE